jgi:hypothetical protein
MTTAILVKVYDNLHNKKYDKDPSYFYRDAILSEDKSVVFIVGSGHLYMTRANTNTPLPFQLPDGRIVQDIDCGRVEIKDELAKILMVFKEINLALQCIREDASKLLKNNDLFFK